MEARITRVGTSLGVIIPKYVAAEGGFVKGMPINIEYKDNAIIITRNHSVRAGWAEAFARYAAEGEEDTLLPDFIDSEAIELL